MHNIHPALGLSTSAVHTHFLCCDAEYTYIYIHVYICTHVYIYIHIYFFLLAHTSPWSTALARCTHHRSVVTQYTNTYMRIYVHTYTYLRAYLRAYLRTYIHIHEY